MQTSYELALNEFRDASAAVRQAFGHVCETREIQIIADSNHKVASQRHADAMNRLAHAEAVLMEARDAPKADAAKGEAIDPPAAPPAPPPLPRVTQAEIDAMANPSWNDAADDQQLRIG